MVGELGFSPESIPSQVPLRMEFGDALAVQRKRAEVVEHFMARGNPGEAPSIAGVTLTSGTNGEGKPASAIVVFSYPGERSTLPFVYEKAPQSGKTMICRNVVKSIREGTLQSYADAEKVPLFAGKPRIAVVVGADANEPASITVYEKANPHPIIFKLCWSKEIAEKARDEWNNEQEQFGKGRALSLLKPTERKRLFGSAVMTRLHHAARKLAQRKAR